MLLLLNTVCMTLSFSLLPQQVEWGWARSWEGAQKGQLTHTGQRDIPHCVASCRYLSKQPMLRDWLSIGLLVGKGEGLPLHQLVAFFFSPLPLLKCPYSTLAFAPSILPSILLLEGGSTQLCGRGYLLSGVNPPETSKNILPWNITRRLTL